MPVRGVAVARAFPRVRRGWRRGRAGRGSWRSRGSCGCGTSGRACAGCASIRCSAFPGVHRRPPAQVTGGRASPWTVLDAGELQPKLQPASRCCRAVPDVDGWGRTFPLARASPPCWTPCLSPHSGGKPTWTAGLSARGPEAARQQAPQ
jgi:hypothetical protein